MLAEHIGAPPLSVKDTPYGFHAAKNLIYCAHRLLQIAEEQQASLEFFDAVLIDEGQDLVNEEPALLYEERQAFYWLAHRSLRPVPQEVSLFEELDLKKPVLRRLIWACDEAQSLDSMMIPNTRTVFGDSWADVFGAGATYRSGIGKSEVMRVSYRTPGPVLVAAHALGMGLLRKGGMLSGPTQQKDWDRLGYEVTAGDFRGKEPVTIHRPARNSPHPLPALTSEPLVTFDTYDSRAEEIRALTVNIARDVLEGLHLSRNILVVTVGAGASANSMMLRVGDGLKVAGIDFYIPSAEGKNLPAGKNPNHFWLDGAVTITTIHRAKGNEADVVYVVGLDEVARAEGEIQVRNQLFTAMSRSRGWLHLSGSQMAGRPFEREVRQVLASHPTLTFRPSPPRRRTDDDE